MAATVVFNGTNITPANDNTGFETIKVLGTGGTPSAISETDVFIHDTGACSVKVSNQAVILWFNNGTGIDFSNDDNHILIWVNFLAAGLLATRASNGLAIALGTTSANYGLYNVAGSDTYGGGWVRYVIDPRKPPTSQAGAGLNKASIQYFGVYADSRPNVAKFDNLVIDRIDYGVGLRVYGTSTTGQVMEDILAADEGTIANKYGITRSDNGVIYVQGSIELGDSVGTNISDLTGQDTTVVYEEKEYYTTSGVQPTVREDFHKLLMVGNTTGQTSVHFGKIVGSGDTAQGRNGLTIVSAGQPVTINFDDGNANYVQIYGTTLRGITGGTGITWGTNTAHEFIGNTVDQCIQFNPNTGPKIRGCIFSGTVDDDGTGAAVAWTDGINLKNCSFIANTSEATDPHGVFHVASGSADYIDMTFTGNDYDILYGSNQNDLTINATRSNPSTFEALGVGTVNIDNTVTLSVTVEDTGQSVLEGVRVRIERQSDGVLISQGETNASGIYQDSSYNYTGDINVFVKARLKGYFPYKAGAQIIDTGLTAAVTLTRDSSVNLP